MFYLPEFFLHLQVYIISSYLLSALQIFVLLETMKSRKQIQTMKT